MTRGTIASFTSARGGVELLQSGYYEVAREAPTAASFYDATRKKEAFISSQGITKVVTLRPV
jgi:hypothetical protein